MTGGISDFRRRNFLNPNAGELPQDKTRPVTELLLALQRGDRTAEGELFELVYGELWLIAKGLMASEHRRNHHTLQPTALIHEAFIRMARGADLKFANNRRFFFNAAARAMGRILIEHERSRNRGKRGGDNWQRLPLENAVSVTAKSSAESPLIIPDHLPWDEVLDQVRGNYGVGFGDLAAMIDKLGVEDARAAEIVWLRFMAGMTMKEIGECFDISETQADTEWRVAKWWLKDNLQRAANREC